MVENSHSFFFLSFEHTQVLFVVISSFNVFIDFSLHYYLKYCHTSFFFSLISRKWVKCRKNIILYNVFDCLARDDNFHNFFANSRVYMFVSTDVHSRHSWSFSDCRWRDSTSFKILFLVVADKVSKDDYLQVQYFEITFFFLNEDLQKSAFELFKFTREWVLKIFKKKLFFFEKL